MSQESIEYVLTATPAPLIDELATLSERERRILAWLRRHLHSGKKCLTLVIQINGPALHLGDVGFDSRVSD